MASNQHVNKVIFGNTALIDISDSTVQAQCLQSGYSAYAADGSKISGTLADGNLLGYGSSSAPIVGVAVVGSAQVGDTTSNSTGVALTDLAILTE